MCFRSGQGGEQQPREEFDSLAAFVTLLGIASICAIIFSL